MSNAKLILLYIIASDRLYFFAIIVQENHMKPLC